MSTEWTAFVQSQIAGGAKASRLRPDTVGRFSSVDQEYRVLGETVGIVDRCERALLVITGADRATWLHNLTTNQVKNLGPGEGNYAFALNVQGRILFDLNMLVRDDAIWVDLDRAFLDVARKHFDKYTITEDVTVTNRTDEVGRFGVVGPAASALLAGIGAGPVEAMASLGTSTVDWSDVRLTIVRHDFCGLLGVEVIADAPVAVALWNHLCSSDQAPAATPVGRDAVDVRRIESGIPWPPHEINDDVLPAETGQFERAVNFQKGCYLGQEVVERMRSRGVVARRLCGVTVDADTQPEPGSELTNEAGQVVGKLTSVCRSAGVGGVVGLAYVRTGSDAPGTRLTLTSGGSTVPATTTGFPLIPGGVR